MVTLVSAGAFAADPPWYTKKATWQETLKASREAFDKRDKEPKPAVPLPDFGRDDFTILAWVRTKVGGTILAKAPARGDWAPQGKALFIRQGQLCYDIGWVGCLKSRGQVADGEWHHVAMTKKGQSLRMYIDGKADRSGALRGGPDVPGHVVKIGYTSPNFPQRPGLTGELDDLRVYRRVLSAKEIRGHVEKLQPAKAPGLVGYWPFDEGLSDASGSGNDATGSGRIAAADGKHGKALKVGRGAYAFVRTSGAGAFSDLIWPLLERDFHIARLFDGVSLSGWQRRNRPGHGWGSVWTVTDGAIDGVQEWPGALGLLATRRAFGDFELRLDVKTDWPIDSGVLLRVSGFARAYQVTLHCRPDGDVGGISVHEAGDRRVPAKGWKKVWKKDDWNQLRVAIKGSPPEIRTWLNDKPMATHKDDGKGERLADSGPIAFKIHGHEECFNNHVYFRDVRILELK